MKSVRSSPDDGEPTLLSLIGKDLPYSGAPGQDQRRDQKRGQRDEKTSNLQNIFDRISLCYQERNKYVY